MSIDDQLNWHDSEYVAAMRKGGTFKIDLAEPSDDRPQKRDDEPSEKVNLDHFKRELAEQAESERTEHQPPKRAMTIVVTGSRDWTNDFLLVNVLETYAGRSVQWHVGDARGVDRMTKNHLTSGGYPTRVYRADWRKGKGAGFERNIEMLETAKPDLVLAFKCGPTSAGTDHTIREARARGIHVIEIVDHAAPVEPKKGEIPFANDSINEEDFPE